MKSSDTSAILEEMHTPLLSTASSAGVLVLASHFGPGWLVLLAVVVLAFCTRSTWRRFVDLFGQDGKWSC